MSQTRKKTPAKPAQAKPMPKKTVARKTPAKAPAKTTLKNTTAKKTTPKKLTMAEMQASLVSLETRMKRANTLTKKSVKTLEEVVTSLDERTRKDKTAQKSALSRRVGRLSNQLEEGMAATRAEIKASLAAALTNPNPSSVEYAVSAAAAKLKTNETQQAQAIAKINRHLANLAKAVEDRIVKDQIAATEALHQVETRLEGRLETIEAEAADALTQIGDKVTTLSEAMDEKHDRTSSIVALKISDLAAQTQAEFDKTTNSIEARLENLERAEREAALIRPDSLSSDMSANVSALSGQVETLQSRLDAMDASFSALQAQTEMMGHDLMRAQGQIQQQATQPAYTAMPSAPPAPSPVPNPSNVVTFTPQETTAPQATASNPYLEAAAPTVQKPAGQPDHFPVEFDPTAFAPQQTQTPQMMQHAAATALAQPEIYSPPPAQPLPTTYEDMIPQVQPQPQSNLAPPPLIGGLDVATTDGPLQYTDVENMPAGDPLLPYADPAYAEETMDAVRIGDDGGRKKRSLLSKKKKPKKPTPAKVKGEGSPLLTGRNMRVAALATGITLVGLFAAKTILSGNEAPTFDMVNDNPPVNNVIPTAPNISVADETAPTIGTYTDNTAPAIAAGEVGTLEAAANSGNAIAQFQLGLSYLEQNRVDEGVDLIRTASQTLPAAQYRLAKLYETGTGVEKNTDMAKSLTERAARAGNRIAMHDLAIYYAYGNGGVNVDMGTAAGWFEKAAERGVVDSQFNLAILFENGQGVTPSQTDAYFWYLIAGSQGDQTAKARILALDEIMAPIDIAAAKTRADNFTPVKINQAANGIFKDLPWAKNNANAAARAQVKQAQTLLTELGFDIGGADGIMGKRTREAITTFERANGMDETGQVTAALVDKLAIAAGA